MRICPQCKGKGYIWVMCGVIYDEPDSEKEECPTCNGVGVLFNSEVEPVSPK